MNLKRLYCHVAGHDWQKRPVQSILKPDAVVGICRRCGDEARAGLAVAAGGRDLPAELIDQDDVDLLTAMYRDGEITEEQFERRVAAVLGDEEARDEIRDLLEESDRYGEP